MDKINIAIFRDGPFLPPREGGSASILGMAKVMVKYANVYLFRCYRGWDNFELYKDLPFTTIFIKPEDFYTDKKLLRYLLKKYQIDVCHFDSTEAINIQSPLISNNILKIWEVHNVDHVLIDRLGFSKSAVKSAVDDAIKAGENSDIILARSEKDKSDLSTIGIDSKKICLYKGAIDTNQFLFSHAKKRNKNIIYLGNLFYGPNEYAVRKIISSIAPNVIAKDPDAKFLFIGPFPQYLEDTIPENLKNNIKFLGEIEDINPILSKARIGLCYIEQASGTRLKILTYLAVGLPTLSTSMGVEGLSPELIQYVDIEDKLDNYCEIILQKLNEPVDINQLEKARLYIENNYSWNCEAKHIVQEFSARLSQMRST